MKLYIILFITIIFSIIISVTYMGMVTTIRVLDGINQENPEEIIKEIQQNLKDIYHPEDETSREIEQISSKLDKIYAALNRGNILKRYIIRRSMIDLIVTGLLGLLSGIFLWYGTMHFIIKPIRNTVLQLENQGKNGWETTIDESGPKEIKYLQRTLNTLFKKIQEYQKQIKQVERENIGSFITHKMKNSMTPIKLCSYNLKELTKESIHAQENIEVIESELNKIEQFIQQFKTFSQIPKLNRTSIQVEHLFEPILSRFNNIQYQSSRNGLTILGDSILLEEVFVNLINNAIDASINENDIIQVSINELEADKVIISIKDSGCGIPEDHLKKVLSEYFTTKHHGMGIGLSYVDKVIKTHGYSWDINSRVGEGTVVRINCYE